MKRLRPLFASILRRWASALSGENLANEDGEPNRNQSNRNSEARHTAPVTRTTVEIPDPVLQEYRRAQEAQETDDRKTRYVSLLAVIIAGGIAGIGIWQGCLTRRANSISLEALKLSEGADLILDNIIFDEVHGVIAYPLNNTGHRTAEVLKEHFEEAIMIRPQNVLIQHAQVDLEQTFEVAPGKQIVGAGQFTIPNWQPDEMKAVPDTTHAIIFGGIISYSNGLGSFKETKRYRFCLVTLLFRPTQQLEWMACSLDLLDELIKRPATFRKKINKYGQENE